MRITFLILSMCTLFLHSKGQKKIIDSSAVASWPMILPMLISNDGNFVVYSITTGKTCQVILQSANPSWKKEIVEANGALAVFTEDSHWMVCPAGTDSVVIVNLFTEELRFITHAKRPVVSSSKNQPCIIYRTGKDFKDVALLNLTTGDEKKYRGVTTSLFSPDGQILLLQLNDQIQDILLWHNLIDGKDSIICRGGTVNGLSFNNAGNKLVFLYSFKNGPVFHSTIRYYEPGMDSSRPLINSTIAGLEKMKVSNNPLKFSDDGKKLFFYIEPKEDSTNVSSSNKNGQITIFTYLDDSVACTQSNRLYLSVIDIGSGTIRQLEHIQDKVFDRSGDGKNVLLESNFVRHRASDADLKIAARPDIYLISSEDGRRKLLKKRFLGLTQFSPQGKYVIFYDRQESKWFSYDIADSVIRNISKKITGVLYPSRDFYVSGITSPFDIVGWLENDDAVLLADRYDIWIVDLKGLKRPLNLTQGYGAKNNICLQYRSFEESAPIHGHTFHYGDTLLLNGFNVETKSNSFYKICLTPSASEGLIPLSTQPKIIYSYYLGGQGLLDKTQLFQPKKAKYANKYIVTIQSAQDYPNLYITHDFKYFDPLTDFAPQKDYNWYTSELIHWKMFDGKKGEGLLFKPEQFDSTHKYPVIFLYYEKPSGGLNSFINPALNGAVINIPWFVSRGYLVFVPDIYYRLGDPGEGVYNAVVSAATYLSKLPFVDGQHIGIQGQSHGSWETNYLVTHTKLFAAAVSVNGESDRIMGFEITPFGYAYYAAGGQGRMGGTIWNKLPQYIKNSPILRADKVTTPLLIIHGEKPGNVVDYYQGKAWYDALKFNSKKVWMVTYNTEGHVIGNENNQWDFLNRMQQFFDHFLKGMPAPKWMTEGGNGLN